MGQVERSLRAQVETGALKLEFSAKPEQWIFLVHLAPIGIQVRGNLWRTSVVQ